MWGWTNLDRAAKDSRFAARMLRKNPAFTAIALIVLAPGIARPLFQISPQRLNQIVRRLSLFIARGGLRIQHMKANVSFDHLRHERIHRAAAGGNVMQHLGAFSLLVDRPLDGLNLPPDSSYAIQQFLLFFCCVCHNKLGCGALTRIPRRVYHDQGLALHFPIISEERHFMSAGSTVHSGASIRYPVSRASVFTRSSPF
jgi:hypothetical protein